MAVELVTNPASGKPAVAETVYRDVELKEEREKQAAIEAQLEVAVPAADEANKAAEEATKRVAALESQLQDQKSLVSQVEALTPDVEPDGAQEGDGSEVSTDGEAEAPVESADEPAGDSETVAVEVTVTETKVEEVDEY